MNKLNIFLSHSCQYVAPPHSAMNEEKMTSKTKNYYMCVMINYLYIPFVYKLLQKRACNNWKSHDL